MSARRTKRIDGRYTVTQAGPGVLQCLGIPVPQRDLCARGQHTLCDGKTQAHGTTCDHRMAALQVELVHIVMPPSTE